MISFKDYLTLNEGAMSSGDIYPYEIEYSDKDTDGPDNARAWFRLESGNKITMSMTASDYFNEDGLIIDPDIHTCAYLSFEIYGEDGNLITPTPYDPINSFETPHMIFRTVLDFTQEYIRTQRPSVVAFGSDSQKRHRLYKRMANIIIQDHRNVVMQERTRKDRDAPEGSMYFVYIGRKEVFGD